MNLEQTDTKELSNAGVPMEVRKPDGTLFTKADGKPVTITLLGRDSDLFVKQTNANSNRYITNRNRKMTAESNEADAIVVLAKCTVGWDGIGIGEDDTPFSYENAIKLYTEYRFIKEQVDEFIGDRANFTRG